MGATGATGPKGDVGPAGPAGPAGAPGKYEQHWALTKGDTSDTVQASSVADAQVYYRSTGLRFVWLGRDVTNCVISATADEADMSYPAPTTTIVMRYYGYVLTETYRRDANGKLVYSNTPVNVTAYC